MNLCGIKIEETSQFFTLTNHCFIIFEVLTVMNMKIAVFWNVALGSLGDHPDDGGSKLL
jgi:hypothetical protein